MNNKILSVILVAGIATTGFAGISSANTGTTLSDVTEKIESGVESLTHSGEKFGKRKGLKNLTDDERLALESMSNEQKQAFFAEKKAEMTAQKEAGKAVVDKLINGESLTADEEATRLELLAKIEERSGSHSKPGAEVIAKVLAGDELTDEDQATLAEMQEKRAEREAQKAILEPIKAKLEAGETLTSEEQAVLDEMKANKSERKGQRGNR